MSSDERGVSSNDAFESDPFPLHKACRENNYLQALRLLSPFTSVDYDIINSLNEEKLTPLDCALRASRTLKSVLGKSDLKLIELLVTDKRLDLNKGEENALRWMCHLDLFKCVKFLLAQRADPNPIDGKIPPLFVCLKNQRVKMINLLIDNNADFNLKYKDESGVDLLLRLTDDVGRDQLLNVKKIKLNLKIWTIFIENGLDVNRRNGSNNTFLHLVRDPPLIRLLLNAGANPDLQNENFESAYNVHRRRRTGNVIRMWQNEQQNLMILIQNRLLSRLGYDIISLLLDFVGLTNLKRASQDRQDTWIGDSESRKVLNKMSLLPQNSQTFTFPTVQNETDSLQKIEGETDLLDKYYSSADVDFENLPRLCRSPRSLRRTRSLRTCTDFKAAKHDQSIKEIIRCQSSHFPKRKFLRKKSRKKLERKGTPRGIRIIHSFTSDNSELESSELDVAWGIGKSIGEILNSKSYATPKAKDIERKRFGLMSSHWAIYNDVESDVSDVESDFEDERSDFEVKQALVSSLSSDFEDKQALVSSLSSENASTGKTSLLKFADNFQPQNKNESKRDVAKCSNLTLKRNLNLEKRGGDKRIPKLTKTLSLSNIGKLHIWE